MSNAIYPSLPGETYPILREPMHNTIVQTSANGMETRVALYSWPLYKWTVPYSFVSAADAGFSFQALVGFFNARHGKWDSFRYSDPYDNSTTGSQFGIGDGTTTQFQIGRVLGGFLEPIHAVNVIGNIKVAGSPTGAYTINSSGLITFTSAPANGAALTADFTYYWRVRFDEDSISFDNFCLNLFEVKKVLLYQVRDLT